jgi:upstream activation factor subunit UAF30
VASPKSAGTKKAGKPASGKPTSAKEGEEAGAEHVTAKSKKDPAKGASPAKKVNGLSKPLKISEKLATVVGEGPLSRSEVVSQMWAYIRKHELQNPGNKREILADDKLKAVFGQDKVTMFEMNKLLSAHLS